MKVVCIDNSIKISSISNPDPSDFVLPLTIGKIYDASLVAIYYSLCCDDGISRSFDQSRFITLEEWRESKLGELGITS
jgi:hypothetical protein